MRELAIRFLTFQALNDHPMIHLGLVLAWLVLVAASIMSLRQQPFSLAVKWTWFAVILLLPLVGVGLYALRCLLTSDFSFLKFLLGPGGTAKSVRPR